MLALGSAPLEDGSGAEIAVARILAAAALVNGGMLVLNLLPFRPLDGGQLLAAARLRMARGV